MSGAFVFPRALVHAWWWDIAENISWNPMEHSNKVGHDKFLICMNSTNPPKAPNFDWFR
jgi:hypothetical protein